MHLPTTRSSAPVRLLALTGAITVLLTLWASTAWSAPQRPGQQSQFAFETQRLNDRITLNVNLASGNLLVNQVDFSMSGGHSPGLSVVRSYNSFTPLAGSSFTKEWALHGGEDVTLKPETNGNVTFTGPSGFVVTFTPGSTAGTYVTPTGLNATLIKESSGAYTLTENKSQSKWRFTSTGRLTELEDRNGRKRTYDYDATNTILNRITDPPDGADTASRYVIFNRNASNDISKVIDPAGREYLYAYNAQDKLSDFTEPGGGVTHYEYSGDQLIWIRTPGGRVAKIEYFPTGDPNAGRVKSVTRVTNPTAAASSWIGHKTSFAYNQNAAGVGTTVVTDERNYQTTHHIDSEGRVEKVVDALGHERKQTYNANSNVLTFSNAANTGTTPNTTATYDADNNLKTTSTTAGSGNQNVNASAEYGATSGGAAVQGGKYLPTSATNAEGSQTSMSYNADGLLTQTDTTLASGTKTATAKLEYFNGADGNPKGVLKLTRDGNNNTTTYEYDLKGNVTKVIPPSPLGAVVYTYDNLARVTSVTDGKGQKRVFTYDDRDRVKKIEFKNASGTIVSTLNLTIDKDGNITGRSDAIGSSTYTFNERNLLTQETLPGNRINSYAYDPASNMLSITTAAGTVLYTYNQVNLLATLKDPENRTTTYSYDKNNQRIQTVLPNEVIETREYDDAQRLKRLAASDLAPNGVDREPITDFTYTYKRASDKQGWLKRTAADAVKNTSTTWTYDHLDRLTQQATSGAVSETYSYSYDANSNRLTGSDVTGQPAKTYSYNAANELCWVYTGSSSNACASPPAGATTYQYDANGNTTSSSDGYSFTYNAQNQTTQIGAPGGVSHAVSYLGVGQTELVTRNGTQYTYNLLGLGQKGSEHVLREPNGRPVSRKDGGTRLWMFYNDHPGSVIGLLDSDGNEAVTYKYDPFGVDKGASNSTDSAARFAGAEYSDILGLYKIGERWYNPKIGRWTQKDAQQMPLDPRQGNGYAYAASDPINHVDPTGRDIFDTIWKGAKKVAVPFYAVKCTYETSKQEVEEEEPQENREDLDFDGPEFEANDIVDIGDCVF